MAAKRRNLPPQPPPPRSIGLLNGKAERFPDPVHSLPPLLPPLIKDLLSPDQPLIRGNGVLIDRSLCLELLPTRQLRLLPLLAHAVTPPTGDRLARPRLEAQRAAPSAVATRHTARAIHSQHRPNLSARLGLAQNRAPNVGSFSPAGNDHMRSAR